MAADLEHPMGCWSREERERALRLMGISLSEALPDDPRFRPLRVNALAATDEVTPGELDWLFHTDTSHLEGEARLAEARKPLADEPTAKRNLLAIIRREQQELRALRDELWETVDRPALEAACERARTFDPSGEATLARRYEGSNALELSRCLNLLSRLKREARQAETEAEPTTPVAPVSDAIPASQAPNELEDGQDCDASGENSGTYESTSGALRASQGRPEGVSGASRARRRRDLQKARRRRRGRS